MRERKALIVFAQSNENLVDLPKKLQTAQRVNRIGVPPNSANCLDGAFRLLLDGAAAMRSQACRRNDHYYLHRGCKYTGTAERLKFRVMSLGFRGARYKENPVCQLEQMRDEITPLKVRLLLQCRNSGNEWG
jgi:hypothetical protein